MIILDDQDDTHDSFSESLEGGRARCSMIMMTLDLKMIMTTHEVFQLLCQMRYGGGSNSMTKMTHDLETIMMAHDGFLQSLEERSAMLDDHDDT